MNSRTRDRWSFDPRWCQLANRWGTRHYVRILFVAISRLGDGGLWYVLMAGMALLGGWRGFFAALHMLCTGAVATLLYRSLKGRTRRPRPFRVHAHVVALTAPLDEYSFPSGHTLHAVCFSIVAVSWFSWLAAPLLAFTLLVAASRVVLGLHYPTDVAAGFILGSGLGALSAWLGSMLVA